MKGPMLYTVRAAGIKFQVSPLLIQDPAWERFLVSGPDENGEDSNKEDPVEFKALCETESVWFHNVRKVELGAANAALLIHETDVMAVSADWRLGRVLSLKHPDSRTALLLQMFYAHAIKRNMIQLHASLIDWKGQGILFLGPSGIGKTTQAELWQKYRNARIINGDIVYLQKREDAFYGIGTPWHGSSPYCENDRVTVCALVVLKQHKENRIRRLSQFELLSQVSDSLFYPQWTEGGMEQCLEVMDHLLSTLPVYELSCRPDEDAVALTEQAMVSCCRSR